MRTIIDIFRLVVSDFRSTRQTLSRDFNHSRREPAKITTPRDIEILRRQSSCCNAGYGLRAKAQDMKQTSYIIMINNAS